MSLEMAFNLLWGVACGVLGLLYRQTLSQIDELHKMIEKMNDRLLVISTNYPTRTELQSEIDRIERLIERILDKLDQKADKE